MSIKKNKFKQQGFTLIEALVATFLFAIVISSVIGIYLTTLRINRRANAIRTASENARFLTELISKEVRNGKIDYNDSCNGLSFGSGTSPYNQLQVINVDNDKVCFYQNGTDLYYTKNSLPAGGTKINDTNTSILNFKVFVTPDFNPYCQDYPTCSIIPGSAVEPRITIVGTVRSNADPQNIIDLPFQTSISIPAYDITP